MMDQLQDLRRFMLLQAESAGLEWKSDGARIKEIAIETERLSKQLGLGFGQEPTGEVFGLYRDGEELCSVWASGTVDRWDFARLSLDFIAAELATSTAFDGPNNFRHFASAFGPAAVTMAFDALAEGLSDLKQETRRWETTAIDDDQDREVEIWAGIGHADDRFDEAPLCRCSADAEGASLITIIDFEIDGLVELVEERDNAARRALRGEAQG